MAGRKSHDISCNHCSSRTSFARSPLPVCVPFCVSFGIRPGLHSSRQCVCNSPPGKSHVPTSIDIGKLSRCLPMYYPGAGDSNLCRCSVRAWASNLCRSTLRNLGLDFERSPSRGRRISTRLRPDSPDVVRSERLQCSGTRHRHPRRRSTVTALLGVALSRCPGLLPHLFMLFLLALVAIFHTRRLSLLGPFAFPSLRSWCVAPLRPKCGLDEARR